MADEFEEMILQSIIELYQMSHKKPPENILTALKNIQEPEEILCPSCGDKNIVEVTTQGSKRLMCAKCRTVFTGRIDS